MRDINSNIVLKFESEEFRPFKLVFLDIGTGYHYTDCDVPIFYDSNMYVPKSFEIESINYSMGTIVDSCQISLDDIDQDLQSDFLGGDPQGSNVVIMQIVIDDDNSIVGATHYTLFNGEIGEWNYEEARVNIVLTNMFSRWSNKTMSKHSSSCRWKQFKGTECTYSGSETWCDRSYSRCSALGNTINFGGFRWLPSIEGLDIWWGATQG